MSTATPSDIFFIISSIGFVTVWILIAVFLVYLIRAMRSFSRIMKIFENDVNKINETAEDIISDIRESFIFKFIFGKKRKSRN